MHCLWKLMERHIPDAARATNTQQTWRQEFLGSRSSTVERSSTRTAAAGTFLRFLQTIFFRIFNSDWRHFFGTQCMYFIYKKKLFSDCRACVKWNNCWSDEFIVNFGVRQGSVLSPFMFAVYIDGIANVSNLRSIVCLLSCMLMISLWLRRL